MSVKIGRIPLILMCLGLISLMAEFIALLLVLITYGNNTAPEWAATWFATSLLIMMIGFVLLVFKKRKKLFNVFKSIEL